MGSAQPVFQDHKHASCVAVNSQDTAAMCCRNRRHHRLVAGTVSSWHTSCLAHIMHSTHRVWHIFQHQMQEGLVLLCGRVEALLQLDDVWVVDHLHDLQLTVLEALVLQHLLDGHLLNTCKQSPIQKNHKTPTVKTPDQSYRLNGACAGQNRTRQPTSQSM